MKTTLFSVYICSENPRGVFIGTRGTGARGTTPGPKPGAGRGRTDAETRAWLRFHGHTRAARGASSREQSRLFPVRFWSRFLEIGPRF